MRRGARRCAQTINRKASLADRERPPFAGDAATQAWQRRDTMAALSNAEILDAIKQKSVLELNELVKLIQDEFGVTPMAMAAPAAAPAAAAEAVEEKTAFDVILTGFGEKKIQVIKAVRELTNLGLREAKELVEGVPKPVKEGINKEDAAAARKLLEDAGGTAEVK
jgi:large subunit ribosomal protein L7/L12